MPVVGAVIAGAAIMGGSSIISSAMQMFSMKSAQSGSQEMMEKMYAQNNAQGSQYMNMIGGEMQNSNNLQQSMMGSLYNQTSNGFNKPNYMSYC